MIINSSSFLRRPPTSICPEQIIVFNAIRFSVDICEVTFERLEKNLFDFTFNQRGNNFIPLIFSDIWTIINNATILKKVICTHFKISEDDTLLINLKKLEGLRHSNQHLDERMHQVKSLNDLPPIYGEVSWLTKVNENESEGILSVIYSGTVYKDLNTKPESPAGKVNNKKINAIKFTGINRIGTTKFTDTSIYLNEIMDCIKSIIINFEKQLEEQFKNIDTTERHISDLILQFKGKEVIQ